MKMGVIGASSLGGALGKIWAANGHQVVFGPLERQISRIPSLATKSGARSFAATTHRPNPRSGSSCGAWLPSSRCGSLESFAPLGVQLAFQPGMGPNHAFKLLHLYGSSGA